MGLLSKKQKDCIKMKNTARKAFRSVPLLCLAALLLCACGGDPVETQGYSTTLALTGTVSENTLDIRYPSGETAASLPLDMASAGFPGRESAAAEAEEEEAALSVFYGRNGAGLCWAVVCSGPSAGSANTNVLLSTDGGETWGLASSAENTPHDLMTGAGFQSKDRGFLCGRYSRDSGPVIYTTGDGGASWTRLEPDIPPVYAELKMTPFSPIITEQSVCFPVEQRDENGIRSLAYCSTQDLENWTWSERKSPEEVF